MRLKQRSDSSDGPRSAPRRIGSMLLWGVVPSVALVLVAGYFALALVRHVYPPVVPVEGVSMRPMLHAGDLVLLRRADVSKLRKGDIIAFRTPTDARTKYGVPGSYVHRIFKVSKSSGQISFRTKGDNVAGPDPFWTSSQNVTGVYAGKIPGGGYPILFVHSKQGKIFVAIAAAILLAYFVLGALERRTEVRERHELELSSLVAESRRLAARMEETVAASRAPPGVGALPAQHLGPPIDFGALERDLHASVGSRDEVQETLRELVAAIGEYGKHLQSHTAVMQGLAASTAELHTAAVEMRTAIGERAAAPPTSVSFPQAPPAPQPTQGETRMHVPSLRSRELRSSFRGYAREDVERVLSEADAALGQASQERSELLERLERGDKERDDLGGRIAELEREVGHYRQLEATLTQAIAAQEQAARELRAQAQREAELVVEEARLKAREILLTADAERGQVEAQVSGLRSVLQGALASLDDRQGRAEEPAGGPGA